MSSRARRTLVSLVVFFCICGLAGMFISQKVGAQSSTDESAFRDSLKQFTNVYQIVAQNYAEPLTGEGGTLTSSLKLRRKAVYDRLRARVEGLYA